MKEEKEEGRGAGRKKRKNRGERKKMEHCGFW